MENRINLSNCCRACLRSSCSLTPINAEDNDALKFSYKLICCVSEVSWIKEGIVSYVCNECIDRLRVSYDFRTTCITADQTLDKCIKQGRDISVQSKNNILFSSKYDCTEVEPRQSIDNLPDEDTNNSEYLHLKHFLDSEDDISKNERILTDNRISRDTSPNSSTSHFITDYTQTQTIEIEVRDIIIQAKSNERDNSNIIVGDGEYTIGSVNTKSGTPEQNIQIDLNHSMQNICVERQSEDGSQKGRDFHDKQNEVRLDSLSPKDVILTPYNDNSVDTDLDPDTSKQDISLKLYSSPIKQKKTTGVQVRPPSPENVKANSNTCMVCGKTYRKKANLKVHMRSHTGEKPFECKYCERRFYHSSHLKEHIRRHTGEKPFQCTICLKRFTIKGELTMHMKSHTGEKPFPCTVCDRRCLTSSDLKIHMRTHTGEKPYTCETCGKKFGSSYILTSHIKTHTGDRPHACKICDKTFTQSSHLNVHMRKHTGEKVVCKYCNANFNHSSQLTVHMREHTGKQPYKCGVCDKLCNYASGLQTHMLKHTGQKFTCTICQKQFTTAAYLTEHVRHHTGENLLTCSVCERQFTRRTYLDKHLRTHTGEKPYSCFVCGKQFSQTSSLKVHTRIHTGERPYHCEICDKKFMTSSDLSAHVKKHKKYINL